MNESRLEIWWTVIGMCLLLAVPQLAFSIQYRGHTQHPALAEHCLYEELELSVPRNGTVFPVEQADFCVRVHCRDDYVLMIKHCDRIQLAEGCHFTASDYSMPYPDCCPTLVCLIR